MHIPPIKKEDVNWARNSEQKAECFAAYLKNNFQLNNLQEEEMLKETIHQDEESIRLVTLDEFKKKIKYSTNTKKAPGFDMITEEIISNFQRRRFLN